MKETITKQINFDKAGYFAVGLIALAFLGFWPTYFSKFFDGTVNFDNYFHFHFAMASLWIALLILQPNTYQKKEILNP